MSQCRGIDNAKIAEISDRCHALEFLELRTAEEDMDLVALLSNLNHLQKLLIKGKSALQLPSLFHMKKLNHLEICFNEFLTDHLLQSIGQLSELKWLSLTEYGLAADHYTQDGMLQLTNLKKLELFSVYGNEHLSDLVLKAIAESNPELKVLKILLCPLITDCSLLFVLDTCKLLYKLHVNNCERATARTFEAIMRKLGTALTYSTSEPGQTMLELNWYGLKLEWKTRSNIIY